MTLKRSFSDLKDLSSLAEHNEGHKFLLCCLDVGSRRLYVRPLLNKSGVVVASALSDIFDGLVNTGIRLPRHLQVDKGREFDCRPVRRLCSDRNINLFFVEDPQVKASSVERVILTLTQMLYRHFSVNNTLEYLSVLPQMVLSYNETVHSALGVAPNDVTKYD